MKNTLVSIVALCAAGVIAYMGHTDTATVSAIVIMLLR